MLRRRDAGRAALSALSLLLALSSCGSSEGATPTVTGSALELFRKVKCSSCHGPDAEGIARMGPALVDVRANWTEEELERYFVDPAEFRRAKPHLEALSREYFAHMRAFPELSAEQRTQLARWLLER